MLPQGMFSVAVATVLFPALARLAARNDLDGFRATVSTGLRQIGFLLIPASVVSAVLAEPIVRLVYERGAFTEADVTVVAGCLAAFSLGLVFNGWMLMLTRGFYGLQSNWLPTAIAVGTLGLNAVLDVALYRVGIWGIPLATSLVEHRRRRGSSSSSSGGASVASTWPASPTRSCASPSPPSRSGPSRSASGTRSTAALGRSVGAQIVSLGVCARARRRRVPRRLPAAPRARARRAAPDGLAPSRVIAALPSGRAALGSPDDLACLHRRRATCRLRSSTRRSTTASSRSRASATASRAPARRTGCGAGGQSATVSSSAGRSAASTRSPRSARRRSRASSSIRLTAERGSASALWDVVSAHLDEIGARRIVAHSRADADSMAFAPARGFSLEATETALAVDPRTLGPPPRPPPGIELAPDERLRRRSRAGLRGRPRERPRTSRAPPTSPG